MIRAIWLAAIAFLLAATAPAAHAFGFADVDRRARELANRPYTKSAVVLPKQLKDLTYDQTRDIRFDPSQSLWRAQRLPFEIQFFHLGGIFDQPVRIYEVVGNEVNEIPFDPTHSITARTRSIGRSSANWGSPAFAFIFRSTSCRVPRGTRTSSCRFSAPVTFVPWARASATAPRHAVWRSTRPSAAARNFRALSSSGSSGPRSGARELVMYALLDSRRVTGAYRFVVRPGADTVTEVRTAVPARAGGEARIAPLTSMFFFGENQRAPSEDFRPEVHDSDGLAIHSASPGNGSGGRWSIHVACW